MRRQIFIPVCVMCWAIGVSSTAAIIRQGWENGLLTATCISLVGILVAWTGWKIEESRGTDSYSRYLADHRKYQKARAKATRP